MPASGLQELIISQLTTPDAPSLEWIDPAEVQPPVPPSAKSALPNNTQPQPTKRGGRSIDFILAKLAAGESSAKNQHLDRFAKEPWVEKLLTDARYHSLVNGKRKGLEKEITEAMSAISVLARHRVVTGTGQGTAVFDLCSGKGITATFLALSYPDLAVHMVDLDGGMNLSHVAALPNCEFHYADLFKPQVEELLLTAAGSGKNVVLLGTHLCGMLAPRLVALYNQVERVSAMLVCPCCLKGSLGFKVKTRAREEGRDYHQVLCETLQSMVAGSAELVVDKEMKSVKNVFIYASRSSEDGCTQEPEAEVVQASA